MTGPLAVVIPVAVGYVSGSLPWGLWLGRWLRGVDVRALGSGNLGATNVYRSLGPRIGVATLLLDVAKGALPVWLVPGSALGAGFPGGPEWCLLAVGLAAIAGHMWTMFAGFKGGKGVATTAGVLLALSPAAFAVVIVVFTAAVALTRFISVGSMLGALALAVTLGLTRGLGHPYSILGAVVGALVILRHRENIGRLLKGQERRFSFRTDAGGEGS